MTTQTFNGVDVSDTAAEALKRRQQKVLRFNMQVWAARVGLLIATLALWEYASGRWIEPFLVSSPSRVCVRFWELLADGTLLTHAYVTMKTATLGFLVGGFLAIVCGYIAGTSRFVAATIEPYISAIWSVPRVALLPVLIVWVGVGQPLAIVIAAILVFFLLFYNTYYGIREVDEELINAMRVMGGSPFDIAVRVRLPSALVWILAGAKISIPQAFVGVVTAEILASNKGLGYLVALYSAQFDLTGAFAALAGLFATGFALDRLLSVVSAKALIWKGAQLAPARE